MDVNIIRTIANFILNLFSCKSQIVIKKVYENDLYNTYYVKNIGSHTATNIQFEIITDNDISIAMETLKCLPIESLSPNNEPFEFKLYTGEKGKVILKYKWKEYRILPRKDSVTLII